MAKIHDHAMRGEREKGRGGQRQYGKSERKGMRGGKRREEGYGAGEVGGGHFSTKGIKK